MPVILCFISIQIPADSSLTFFLFFLKLYINIFFTILKMIKKKVYRETLIFKDVIILKVDKKKNYHLL